MLDQALAVDGGGGGRGCHWALRSHNWRVVREIPSRRKSPLVTHPGAQKGDPGCSHPSILRFGTLDRPALHLDLCCPEICKDGAVTSSLETLFVDRYIISSHPSLLFFLHWPGRRAKTTPDFFNLPKDYFFIFSSFFSPYLGENMNILLWMGYI